MLTETYLRGVLDYELILIRHQSDNSYLTIKRIIKTVDPLIVDGITYLADGYYIVELTPLDQYYNARAFINTNLDVVGYYFNISRGNGVINGVPYYDDLYLDIIHHPGSQTIPTILDEDELQSALQAGFIDQHVFDFAHCICSSLFEEIKAKKTHSLIWIKQN